MKMLKVVLPIAALTLLSGPVAAQSDDQRALAAEKRADAMALRAEEREAASAERLREAEARMAEAARQIAEITSQRIPQMARVERLYEFSDRPRIGVMIDGAQYDEPVAGVEITGVTPGSPADDAGLRPDDVITSVNGESMSADNGMAATKKLMKFMEDVTEGDDIDIEYLRNGNVGTVELSPRVMEKQAYSWIPDGQKLHIQKIPGFPAAPHAVKEYRMEFGFPWAGSSWGSMELVELNEGLSKYFGTDGGLLVISAPESGAFELQDGDVIKQIDGREPSDVRHALRILSSYKAGEELRLEIMRDKKKRTLNVEVPEDHRSSLQAPLAPAAPLPASAPLPPIAPMDETST